MIDWELVRQVSRSFYLTLRVLPGSVRETIALAYLLARATDSLADAEGVPPEVRGKALELARASIAQGGEAKTLSQFPTESLVAGERALLERFRELVCMLDDSADADLVRELLAKITEGQQWDLERFDQQEPEVLGDEELEHYTYLVAGSVGEFWTELGERRVRSFAARPMAEMLELGVRYGKGLQLVNMLRDLAGDLEAGRAYLDAGNLGHLFERARRYVESGFQYAESLRSGRLRYATVLPAALALPTLDEVEAVGAEFPVKIPRAETKATLFRCWPALLWRKGVRAGRPGG